MREHVLLPVLGQVHEGRRPRSGSTRICSEVNHIVDTSAPRPFVWSCLCDAVSDLVNTIGQAQ